jgi:hypothetical protein
MVSATVGTSGRFGVRVADVTDHPKLSRLVVPQRSQDGIDEAVDAAAQQILERGRGALVRDHRVLVTARPNQKLGGEVPRRPDRAYREGRFTALLLREGEQRLDVGDRQILGDGDRSGARATSAIGVKS